MQDSPSVIALRDHLRVVVATHPTAVDAGRHDELRCRVCAVVDELKSANFLPEQVVIAVKQIALDAGLVTSHAHVPGRPSQEMDAARVDLVAWSIKHYYGEALPPISDTTTS